MKAELVSLECLFLHDTQMADLEREQAALRAMARDRSRADESGWIPVAFAHAFCPLAPVPYGSGKLIVGAPEACGGWIIRPVSFEVPAAPPKSAGRAAKPPMLPRFPPLPETPGFILGFADPEHPDRAPGRAAELAERLTERIPAKAFTVNAWYTASLSLEIILDDGRSYGVISSIGKPRWRKLTPN